MTFTFFRRGRLVTASAGDRLGKIRKVLSKADIPFDKENPESALAHIAPRVLPLNLTPVNHQVLEFPIEATERIAVLSDGFALPKSARKINYAEVAALREYAPQGLVGGLHEMKIIGQWQNRLELDDALVILSSLHNSTLLEHADRNTLWNAFGVPVFENLRSWDGTVIARECQVHDGLHVMEDTAIVEIAAGELVLTQLNRFDQPVVRVRTGVVAELVRDHCECGEQTARLRGLAAIQERSIAAAA